MKILVERKKGFDNKAQTLAQEFKNTLGIEGVKEVRYLNMYVITGTTKQGLAVYAEDKSKIILKDSEISVTGGAAGVAADWGWLLREARAASTAGSPRVPSHLTDRKSVV